MGRLSRQIMVIVCDAETFHHARIITLLPAPGTSLRAARIAVEGIRVLTWGIVIVTAGAGWVRII
jgi:hypothetical protein